MHLHRDGDVVELVKDNDKFGYMYINEKDVLIWQLIQGSEVDGDLEYTCSMGVKSWGCTREIDPTIQNGGGTTVFGDSGKVIWYDLQCGGC